MGRYHLEILLPLRHLVWLRSIPTEMRDGFNLYFGTSVVDRSFAGSRRYHLIAGCSAHHPSEPSTRPFFRCISRPAKDQRRIVLCVFGTPPDEGAISQKVCAGGLLARWRHCWASATGCRHRKAETLRLAPAMGERRSPSCGAASSCPPARLLPSSIARELPRMTATNIDGDAPG